MIAITVYGGRIKPIEKKPGSNYDDGKKHEQVLAAIACNRKRKKRTSPDYGECQKLYILVCHDKLLIFSFSQVDAATGLLVAAIEPTTGTNVELLEPYPHALPDLSRDLSSHRGDNGRSLS